MSKRSADEVFHPFWFDGNLWHGWVTGPEAWAELQAAYGGDAFKLPSAQRCPSSWYNFGFRIEHGGETLLDWAKNLGMDEKLWPEQLPEEKS